MNIGKIPLFWICRSLILAADGHLLLFFLIRFAVQPLTGLGAALVFFLVPGTAWNLFLLDRILHGKDPDPEKRDRLSPFLLFLIPALTVNMVLFLLTRNLLPRHPVWFVLCTLPFPAAAWVLSLKKKFIVRQGLLAPLLLFPVILLLGLSVYFLFCHAGQTLVPTLAKIPTP